ncbi:MAG: FAD-dependent oxidoreductase [Gemmatimonadales bacterium]
MSHYVLVGSGAAALAAAEELRRGEPAARITVIGQESAGFYSRPGLAYLLTGAVPESQLELRTRGELTALRLERITDRATLIRTAAQRVVLSGGREIGYDRLLLATGARSLAPDFPGATLEGVFRLDRLDQAMGLVRAARRRRRAVVVGGGSTALELVDGLRARGVETHYFLRGERYWARTLAPEESALVEARLSAGGVRLHRRTSVARAVGRGGRLTAVETAEGRLIPCDILCVATGIAPRIELAQASGLATDRGILVNAHLETSEPAIFAAGDVAQVRDRPDSPGVLDALWSSALAQGSIAASNMRGQRVTWRRQVPMNVTCLGGLVTTVMGDVGGEADPDLVTITRGQSERWHLGRGATTVAENATGGRIRLVLSDRMITGAVIMGEQTLAEPVRRLIGSGADIGPIRQALIDDPAHLTATLLAFAETHGGRAA